MELQKVADLAEAAALDRFLTMRESFLPCWGATAPERVVSRPRVRRRRHPSTGTRSER